jgi:exo-1,4-beta-D-glucosaminidase
VRYELHLRNVDLAGNSARQLTTLPTLAGLSSTYFIELQLASADGKPFSRNVYWLSIQPDKLDWAHSNWYLTPVTQYADLTALQSLPTATSDIRATMRRQGAEDIATVTLTVPASSRAVALFQHVSIKQSADGKPVLPILWSDNDVTLWPGESLTLTAHFAMPGAAPPVVEVTGWNIPIRRVPVAAENRTDASLGIRAATAPTS